MLKVENSLILMIDIQEKLVTATNADLEAQNAKKLIETAKLLSIPTIVTEQYPKGLGETVSNIKEIFGKVQVFEKTAFSALNEPEILEAIEKTAQKQVILFGIELHICVYQTALELLERGYEVFVVKNASKSRQDYDFEVGIEILKSKGANITTVEIVLFELLKTAKHSKFKEIQALIK